MKKFKLDKAAHKATQAATQIKVLKDEDGVSVDQTLYRSMIGILLYFNSSRLGIFYVVGVCGRYQSNHKVSHLSFYKRIIKYVCDTNYYGIWFTNDTSTCIVGYCDADWVGSTEDRKSTSGACYFLCNNLVSWFCKK